MSNILLRVVIDERPAARQNHPTLSIIWSLLHVNVNLLFINNTKSWIRPWFHTHVSFMSLSKTSDSQNPFSLTRRGKNTQPFAFCLFVFFLLRHFCYWCVWNQGRIQDFVLGRTKVGEGFGDRLRSPAGPAKSPLPEAPGFWVFRKLFRQQFWSILWMWWSVLKRMNLLQTVSNSF
jgi:hypothetical protein